MVSFDTIIKGMHPFPRNMLINSTFGLWLLFLLSAAWGPGVEATGIYQNTSKMVSDIAGEISILLILYYLSSRHADCNFFSAWRWTHLFCKLSRLILSFPKRPKLWKESAITENNIYDLKNVWGRKVPGQTPPQVHSCKKNSFCRDRRSLKSTISKVASLRLRKWSRRSLNGH